MSVIFKVQEDGYAWRAFVAGKDFDWPADDDDLLECAVREASGDFEGDGSKFVGNYQMIEDGEVEEMGRWMLDEGEFTNLG